MRLLAWALYLGAYVCAPLIAYSTAQDAGVNARPAEPIHDDAWIYAERLKRFSELRLEFLAQATSLNEPNLLACSDDDDEVNLVSLLEQFVSD